MELTHFDEDGNAIMVDVGSKADTEREAIAKGRIRVSKECFEAIRDGRVKKGNVLAVAQLAGIMGTKKTAELIPLCHLLNLTKAEVTFELFEEALTVEATCTVRCIGKTGVEMEALTGVSVALLTIYDMCKAIDKTMVMESVYLCRKSGGRSGLIENAAPGER